MRNFLLYLLACSCLLYTGVTDAQLAQNLTVGSAKALSLANAVTADPPGIDSIHFNPAGLYKVKDRQYQLKLIAGQFSVEGKIERSERYLQELEDNGYQYDDDPVEEGESSTQDVSVMLPIVGLTDIPVMLAPAGGASLELYQHNIVMGTSAFAPMVLGFNRGDNSPLRYQGNKLGITHLTYFSPTIAFELIDNWTVGLGIHVNYTGIGLDMDLRLVNPVLVITDDVADIVCSSGSLRAVINLCEGDLGPFTDIGNIHLEVEDNFNLAFNLGVLWEPTPWFAWGVVYQSGNESELGGEYAIEYGDDWLAFWGGVNSNAAGGVLNSSFGLPKGIDKESGKVAMTFAIPEHIATGVSLRVLPNFKVNFDVKWTDTAVWEEFRLEFTDTPDFLPLLSVLDPERAGTNHLTFPRNYESTLTWAMGIEYQYDDRLALRIGYEDRGNAIPSQRVDFVAPFGEAFLVGGGFSWQLSKDELFEFGAGFLSSSNGAADNESLNANSREQIIYNPYAGADIEAEVTAYIMEVSYQRKF